MKQSRKTQEWADRVWVSGGTETIDLPIGLDLESLHVYLRGNINVTTAYTGIKSEGLAKLIDKLELLADGKVIGTIPFTIMTHANYSRHIAPIKINPGIAVGNYLNVEAVGFLDMTSIGCVRPKDSNFATKGLRTLQLRIRYATLADMYIGAGVAVATLQTMVCVRQTDETDHGKLPELFHKHDFTEKPYTTNMSDRIQLPTDTMIRSIVLRAESAGELSTAVIQRVKVMVGNSTHMDVSAAALYDQNSCDNDGLALPLGYYVVDFAPEPSGLSKVSDFIDLYGRNDAYITLDVVGGATNKVQMLFHNYEPIHQHINANAVAAA